MSVDRDRVERSGNDNSGQIMDRKRVGWDSTIPKQICYQVALQLHNRVKRKYRGIIEPSVPYMQEGSIIKKQYNIQTRKKLKRCSIQCYAVFQCIFKDLLTNLNVRFWFFSKRESSKPPTYQTKLTSFKKNCDNVRRSLRKNL